VTRAPPAESGPPSSPAERGRPGGGSPISLERTLLATLNEAKDALAAGRLADAAQLMQTANELCESAVRDPSCLSRTGLAEIQRLFAACLDAGRPLQDELVRRMSESAAPGRAAKAYRPRRGIPGR